ncbi:late competence development ComFB family protein [Thiomicrorhabdus indica]|uniref:late competence development ComFB family protein n=1 Tax=Thiomicrorhabdus indica TaxID=2267253 RepID=UPI002AA8FCEF|nr:late competence development ComFB family protein [Thiomicrorhabdus indica]
MALDSVHNYYERLVFNEIRENYTDLLDSEELADMACIALNRLEPRYIRYDIDMSFFMTPEQYLETEKNVAKACKKAYKKMLKFQEMQTPDLESRSENED